MGKKSIKELSKNLKEIRKKPVSDEKIDEFNKLEVEKYTKISHYGLNRIFINGFDNRKQYPKNFQEHESLFRKWSKELEKAEILIYNKTEGEYYFDYGSYLIRLINIIGCPLCFLDSESKLEDYTAPEKDYYTKEKIIVKNVSVQHCKNKECGHTWLPLEEELRMDKEINLKSKRY